MAKDPANWDRDLSDVLKDVAESEVMELLFQFAGRTKFGDTIGMLRDKIPKGIGAIEDIVSTGGLIQDVANGGNAVSWVNGSGHPTMDALAR
jgi:hypothetical protein